MSAILKRDDKTGRARDLCYAEKHDQVFPNANNINARPAPVKTIFVSAEILSHTGHFHM